MSITIKGEILILVEGQDEINFFKALGKHLQIGPFEIEESGGNKQFKKIFPAIVRAPGFKNVKKLLIVQDADENMEGTLQSLTGILRKEKLKQPAELEHFSTGTPSVCVFLMPGNSENGMLEDLCLKTVQDDPGMKCVEGFSDCVATLDEQPKNIAKAKAQVFLATKPVIKKAVGIAALKGYWHLDSPELDPIKNILQSLNSPQ
jgi:hypothetical protein